MSSNYSPLQYSLARADVIGKTTQGIGSAIIDFSNKIPEIIKQKNVTEKINNAYKSALSTFVDQAKANGMPEDKATLAAVRVIRRPIAELGPEANIKMLLDSAVQSEKYLEKLKLEYQTQQKTEGAQRAVTGEKTPVTGFTEDVGPVYNQQLPAATQEEAMSRYGDLSAREQVPVQGAKELRDQPAIAALPEAEKPLTTYEKWKMKFEDDKAERDARERKQRDGKNDEKDRDDNLKWAAERETEYLADSDSNKEKASKLKQSIIRLKSMIKNNQAPVLPSDKAEELRAYGIEGELDLQTLERELVAANKMIIDSKAEAKRFGRMAEAVAKGSSLSSAYTGAGDAQQVRSDVTFEEALSYIQQNLAPKLSGMNGSTRQILSQLPQEYQSVVQGKIRQARQSGLSDFDIYQRLIKRR